MGTLLRLGGCHVHVTGLALPLGNGLVATWIVVSGEVSSGEVSSGEVSSGEVSSGEVGSGGLRACTGMGAERVMDGHGRAGRGRKRQEE
ncbi:hypothetical protein IAQ61_011846 [Plenodomus lingam]|uniref:uncharacterized protein n=1 Tax=Leptosphaeria maculans TaxID=5022 RepID=UPI0033267F96|nr:hypothetical protein IAQ61_011846 [Plenodomus lingam]